MKSHCCTIAVLLLLFYKVLHVLCCNAEWSAHHQTMPYAPLQKISALPLVTSGVKGGAGGAWVQGPFLCLHSVGIIYISLAYARITQVKLRLIYGKVSTTFSHALLCVPIFPFVTLERNPISTTSLPYRSCPHTTTFSSADQSRFLVEGIRGYKNYACHTLHLEGVALLNFFLKNRDRKRRGLTTESRQNWFLETMSLFIMGAAWQEWGMGNLWSHTTHPLQLMGVSGMHQAGAGSPLQHSFQEEHKQHEKSSSPSKSVPCCWR